MTKCSGSHKNVAMFAVLCISKVDLSLIKLVILFFSQRCIFGKVNATVSGLTATFRSMSTTNMSPPFHLQNKKRICLQQIMGFHNKFDFFLHFQKTCRTTKDTSCRLVLTACCGQILFVMWTSQADTSCSLVRDTLRCISL